MRIRYAHLLSLLSLFLLAATPSFGQSWSGILAPARAKDWSLAGIPGGIPNRTTVCANVTAGTSTSAIQTAINNCPAGQVVSFGAGTFNVTGLYVNKGITLRGQGPNSTTLVLSGKNIFLGPYGTSWLGSTPSSHTVTSWTGGLQRGSTVLTVGSTSGLSAGQTIIMDELNPPWVFVTGQSGTDGSAGRGSCSGGEYNCYYGSTARAAPQMTKIVSVNSATQITVRDPVVYTHTAGLSPQVFAWSPSNLENAGVEDMSVNANKVEHAIGLMHCDYCWVKNVRVDNVGRSGVTTRYGYGMVLRDSYLSAPPAKGGPTQYGTECYMSSNVLVENNIFWNITDHIQVQNCTGNVYSYNYIHNRVADNLFPQMDTHGSHNHFHLMEGNDVDKIQLDNVWGSGSHTTIFRNRINGYGENKTNYRAAIGIAAHNRHMNLVANVAGTTGHHTNYQCDNAHVYGSDNYVFDIGFWNDCQTGTSNYDNVVGTTVMKWGNWDAATYLSNGNTNGIRYCTASGAGNVVCSASETASGDPTFPALASPGTTFPASFYLSAKPAWFGSVPWPPIGPDVTCSSNCVSNAANRANKIPARLCYEATAKDSNGNLTAYDARTCYATGTAPALPAPSGLRIVP